MDDVDHVGCLACDLAAGRRPLPGGRVHEAEGWVVEHCVGPLGVGTLLVKPLRHVVRVADLDDRETAAFGRVLRDACAVVGALTDADQVYTCLWSHADGVAGHVHVVVMPVTAALVEAHDGARGPLLQAAMFERDVPLDPVEVAAFAERARAAWPSRTGAGAGGG